MPKVPTLEPNQVQLQATPDARLRVQAPEGAFGGGLMPTRAAGNFAEVTARIANAVEKEKAHADNAAAIEARNSVKRYVNEVLYNPQSGATFTKGKNALGIHEKVGPGFEKFVSERMNGLKNERQKKLFQRYAFEEGTDLRTTLNKHVGKEIRAFADEQTAQALALESESAARLWTEPGRVERAIETQKDFIREQASRNGLPAEWVATKIRDAESDTHKKVINSMLASDDDQAAMRYFKENKGSMNANDAKAAESAIEEGYIRGESYRRMDGIVAKAYNATEAYEMANKIKDDKVRERTVREVKSYFSSKAEAQRLDRENMFQDAARALEKTRKRESVPPDVWNQLTHKQRKVLEDILSGKEVESDLALYYDLRDMAVDNPQKFLKINLPEYQNKLAKPEMNALFSLQKAIKNKKESGKEDPLLHGMRSDSVIMADAIKAMGFTSKIQTPGNNKRIAAFKKRFDEMVIAEQNLRGKPLNALEKQAIADQLTMKVVTERGYMPFGWGDTKKFQFEVDPRTIPSGERQKIIDEFSKVKGRAPSEDEIFYIFTNGNKVGR